MANGNDLTSIQTELKEGVATVDKTVLALCQAETVEATMITYFRIMKNAAASIHEDENDDDGNDKSQRLRSNHPRNHQRFCQPPWKGWPN